jgi:hypothetical protein
VKGDKHRPRGAFMRWIESFKDGMAETTRHGKKKVPSLVGDKRETRRWRRRFEKGLTT